MLWLIVLVLIDQWGSSQREQGREFLLVIEVGPDHCIRHCRVKIKAIRFKFSLLRNKLFTVPKNDRADACPYSSSSCRCALLISS